MPVFVGRMDSGLHFVVVVSARAGLPVRGEGSAGERFTVRLRSIMVTVRVM